MASKKFVLPGDKVGTTEEYTPNFGVYPNKDELFSSNIGQLDIDAKKHSARVTCSTRIPKMQNVGVIAVGIIAQLFEQTALIDLVPSDSNNFSFVPQEASAVLHISDIKRGYVDNMRSQMRIGDIVRVKITDVSKHSVKLTMDDKNLGVIKAYCSQCRNELKKIENGLVCESCDHKEPRKFADDYGTGKL